MKILVGWILPIIAYAYAYTLMDMSFGKEILVGLLFLAGVNLSRLGDSL